MAIKITEQTTQTLQFQLTGGDTPYANALRRVMVAEVATLAIDSITIEENTSPLFDEFIAHRMGLIPIICTSLENLEPRYRCKCGIGCSKCNRTLSLNVFNSTDSPLNVTTNDLLGGSADTYPVHSDRNPNSTLPQLKSHLQPIVIAKLAPGQTLRMNCVATKSIGKEHAKFIPGHIKMYPLPKITLNQAILSAGKGIGSKERKELASVCPTNAISYKKDTDSVEIENALACVQCMECMKTAETLGAIDGIIIEEDENVFFYTIESFGQLSPIEILKQGLQNFKTKIDTITQDVIGVQRNQQQDSTSMFG